MRTYLKSLSQDSEFITIQKQQIMNDLLMCSDCGLIFMLVLLDFCAAVHNTDHNILLQKLEHNVGIKGTLLL